MAMAVGNATSLVVPRISMNGSLDGKGANEEEELSNGGENDGGVNEEVLPELDIIINNVVCSFNVRCHLNLRDIAYRGLNVEYRRENGMVTMKLRQPYTTASIWSSGKITCTGANSEDQAHIAARRYARLLQKLGFNCRFKNYRVVNVLGTCNMPFGINITEFSKKHRQRASYEPELHPGVTYKLIEPKATLKIFSTGSITVTAHRVQFVQIAIEQIFPLVYEFKKPKPLGKNDQSSLGKPDNAFQSMQQGLKRKRSQNGAQNRNSSDQDDN